jgi:indolepyruvate ferredoxin oxidoreductase beta subunit
LNGGGKVAVELRTAKKTAAFSQPSTTGDILQTPWHKIMKTKKEKKIPVDPVVNVLFCGTGGQGVLTASEICAVAAVNSGYHVKKSEVHGMAQRGGSVESHLRFGKKVFSPLIAPGGADYVVCFHQGEGQRMGYYLKKNGLSFLEFFNDPRYQPADRRFGNTFALGILSAFLPLSQDVWASALKKQLKRALVENEQAFFDGRRAGINYLGNHKDDKTKSAPKVLAKRAIKIGE